MTRSAAKMAGSDDFGSDSFREPLDVFLGACRRGGGADHLRAAPRLQDARLVAVEPDAAPPLVARSSRGQRRADRQPLDHRRTPPHRDERALHVARARPLGPAFAPVGGCPSHSARHPRRGGGGSPYRPHGQGSRRADETQSPAQSNAPLRGHAGRGVRLALHVRRPLHGARDAGPRPDVRALARAGRHDARLRPAPPGAPDAPVTPADGTLDSQDAQCTSGISTPCWPPTRTPG